ncbi:hypothetical protein AX15_005505 [Amanita polypyramis BW_CC]|nr:hypothetical protein AX15_005505 [Amanita polypyramis BW_CC]
MNSWKPHLHWSFEGEHVLFPNLYLNSWPDFFLSCVLAASVCVIERLLAISLDKHLAPPYVKRLHWRYAVWRTVVYGLATCMRLCYMLIAMTFNMGLILVIITSLACAQLILVELPERRAEDARLYTSVPSQYVGSEGRRLLDACSQQREEPGSITIHPPESDISHADAIVLEQGINSNTSTGNIRKAREPRRVKGMTTTLFDSHVRSSQSAAKGDEDDFRE